MVDNGNKIFTLKRIVWIHPYTDTEHWTNWMDVVLLRQILSARTMKRESKS